ncbi:MAG: hypothetical protein SH820_16705, partial [Xanthomonadales bacterium]|nr:hypothetical protein [Xanthomonadales bacterium]
MQVQNAKPTRSAASNNSINEFKLSKEKARRKPIRVGTTLSWLLAFAVILTPAQIAIADYLGTSTIRVFLDPNDVNQVANGLQVGDTFTIIGEVTPGDTGSDTGQSSWNTFYTVNGAKVVAAGFKAFSGGNYIDIAAQDTDAAYNGCGSRGCNIDAASSGTLRIDDGFLNKHQQDTGVFYSRDPRTEYIPGAGTPPAPGASVFPPLIITGGADILGTPMPMHNIWDFHQTLAFGVDVGDGGGTYGNNGRGNIPVFSNDSGATWYGTGSPIAGPHTYYTNDVNPYCGTSGTQPTTGVLIAKGTVTSNNGGTQLNDTTAVFNLNWDNAVGALRIFNTSDGSSANVTSINSTTQITSAALSGGTQNDWDIGENYEVRFVTGTVPSWAYDFTDPENWTVTGIQQHSENTNRSFIGSGNDNFDNLQCVGPWRRLQVPNDKIGGSGAVLPTAVDPGTILNNSVATGLGDTFAGLGGELPTDTNAVRFAFGARVIGDIELFGITVEITNVNDFLADVANLCVMSLGSDTADTSAKDNPWRYYEPVFSSPSSGGLNCLDFNPDANLLKQAVHKSKSATLTTGSVAANNPAGTQLIHAAANFITAGVTVGDVVRNTSDNNSVAVVISVDSATQITHTPLSGGTQNDWDNGENYQIYRAGSSSALVVADEDVISYEITFTNTTNATMNGILLKDRPFGGISISNGTLEMDLQEPKAPGCIYGNYNATFSSSGTGGAYTANSASLNGAEGPAAWGAINGLAPGDSVKVYMCSRVKQAGTGDILRNLARAEWTGCTPFSLNGTVTSNDGGDDLIDSNGDFLSYAIFAGDTVTNIGDGNSTGTVTVVDSNTNISHSQLSGGTQNDWDTGEQYAVSIGCLTSVASHGLGTSSTLTVAKNIISDNGGTATLDDFNVSVNALEVAWNNPASTGNGVQLVTSNPAVYTLSEANLAGYVEGSWSCADSNNGNAAVAVTNGGAFGGSNVTLGAGQDVVCTITNNDIPASLTVTKTIVSDNGGTAVVGDFDVSVNAVEVSWPNLNSTTGGTQLVTSSIGTYTLSEANLPGYAEGTWSCVNTANANAPVAVTNGGAFGGSNVTVSAGQDVSCSITNNDDPATLTITKVIVSNNGGTAVVGDFDVSVNAVEVSWSNVNSTTGGTQLVASTAGLYTLSEIDVAGYAEGTWSCVDTANGNAAVAVTNAGAFGGSNVTVASGQTVSCTITNDDIAIPGITIDKEGSLDLGVPAIATVGD